MKWHRPDSFFFLLLVMIMIFQTATIFQRVAVFLPYWRSCEFITTNCEISSTILMPEMAKDELIALSMNRTFEGHIAYLEEIVPIAIGISAP